MASEFYNEAINEGEELETFEFFYDTRCAFLEQSNPAAATIIRYEGKYVISVDGDSESLEDFNSLPDDFYDETIYKSYEDARQQCLEIQSKGIKSGKEQIAECLAKIPDADKVFIKPCKQLYTIDFKVFYCGMLLIEHMRGLYPDVVDEAIQTYKSFCQKYDIEISDIYKEDRERNSNQRYYQLEFTDIVGREESYRVHIRSALQGQQRCTLNCINEKNFAAFLEEKRSHT